MDKHEANPEGSDAEEYLRGSSTSELPGLYRQVTE